MISGATAAPTLFLRYSISVLMLSSDFASSPPVTCEK